ncbi:MAG TPA: hypothetical protein VK864_18640, partial [Longimicrobiales bacterium]|nr:hypothetical protein [Longimicrobiales bacterium]
GRSYGVEAVVRQIQALADRILAQLRSGAGENAVQGDLADLAQKIASLRAGLRAGGGQMPASLDSLLARYAADTMDIVLETGGE